MNESDLISHIVTDNKSQRSIQRYNAKKSQRFPINLAVILLHSVPFQVVRKCNQNVQSVIKKADTES